MCTIFLAYKVIDSIPLLIAANRDEFYSRPTQAMHFWDEDSNLLAGRDLKAGGTWLGVTTFGTLAMVTNFRDPKEVIENPLSRGQIPERFLKENPQPESYLQCLAAEGHRYRGFNLILGSVDSLFYYSNRSRQTLSLTPGVYGLSNHFLNTPWPKVTFGLEEMRRWGNQPENWSSKRLFTLLENQERPPDANLPDTGVGLAWERLLSSIFITSENYGTRHSTLLRFHESQETEILERLWLPNNQTPEETRFVIPGSVSHA